MLKKFILFIFLLGTDQVSKYIIRQTGGFYICNKGIAFGISGIYFWLILFLIIALFIWQRKKIKELIFNHCLLIIFILAGALSNLIDRFIFGCVIDFIDLKFWPVSIVMPSIINWPIFNLADVYIVVGFLFIIYHQFRLKNNQKTRV